MTREGLVLSLGQRMRQAIVAILRSGSGGNERPCLGEHTESNVVPSDFPESLGLGVENGWEGSILRTTGLVLLGLLGASVFGAGEGGHHDVLGFDISSIPAWTGLLVWAAGLGGLVLRGVRGDGFAWLGLSFSVCYTVYGTRLGKGEELWPFEDWGYRFLSFSGRTWSFWCTAVYTALVTVFGLQAVKRWGVDRRDTYQIWRYVSLMSFQWILFFLVPEFLFRYAIQYQWVGERIATDPTFAGQAWRSYGIVYAWPLFFYTFFYNPHQVWIVWGVLLTFVIIPIFVLFHGKRYCSWICGCGALAETLGDRWRHLAPKGRRSIQWELMQWVVLGLACTVTALVIVKESYGLLAGPADLGIRVYRLSVDLWLVAILPVALYPFLGGKVWCRYWCPLAALMQLESYVFTKLRWSRFGITANEGCSGCNECSRNCQVGIDVMDYALKQETLDNSNSSCIGCGICVSVCPMDVLAFQNRRRSAQSATAIGT